MKKRHKNVNLCDKNSQTSETRHKNVKLCNKKSQHSEEKIQKCKFMW